MKLSLLLENDLSSSLPRHTGARTQRSYLRRKRAAARGLSSAARAGAVLCKHALLLAVLRLRPYWHREETHGRDHLFLLPGLLRGQLVAIARE